MLTINLKVRKGYQRQVKEEGIWQLRYEQLDPQWLLETQCHALYEGLWLDKKACILYADYRFWELGKQRATLNGDFYINIHPAGWTSEKLRKRYEKAAANGKVPLEEPSEHGESTGVINLPTPEQREERLKELKQRIFDQAAEVGIQLPADYWQLSTAERRKWQDEVFRKGEGVNGKEEE